MCLVARRLFFQITFSNYTQTYQNRLHVQCTYKFCYIFYFIGRIIKYSCVRFKCLFTCKIFVQKTPRQNVITYLKSSTVFWKQKKQLLIHEKMSYQRIDLIWKEFESPFNSDMSSRAHHSNRLYLRIYQCDCPYWKSFMYWTFDQIHVPKVGSEIIFKIQ